MASGRRLERPQTPPLAMPDMAGPPPVASEFGAFARPRSRGAATLRRRLPPWMVLPFGDDAPRKILVMAPRRMAPPPAAPPVTPAPPPGLPEDAPTVPPDGAPMLPVEVPPLVPPMPPAVPVAASQPFRLPPDKPVDPPCVGRK